MLLWLEGLFLQNSNCDSTIYSWCSLKKISKHDLKLLILLEEIMAWCYSSALLLLLLDSWLWSLTLQQCMENFLMLLLKKILIFKGWRQDWCCHGRTIAPAVVIFIVPLNYVLFVMMETADPRGEYCINDGWTLSFDQRDEIMCLSTVFPL